MPKVLTKVDKIPALYFPKITCLNVRHPELQDDIPTKKPFEIFKGLFNIV
jgi:hypothetical protein